MWPINFRKSIDATTSLFRQADALLFPVIRRCLFVLSGTLLLACAGWSQVESGQIAGTITDESGAVVPHATIAVRNIASNVQRTALSSETGAYVLVGLGPGTYSVTVRAGNFKEYSTNVEVTVGSHVTLDAKLSVNSTVTEVQVVAEGGAAVNTQTQELSQMVDTQTLARLPSLTRNPYDFVVLSGNVSNGDNTTNSFNSGQNLYTRGVGYAVNGQRQSGTGILLDGVENVSAFFSILHQWSRAEISRSGNDNPERPAIRGPGEVRHDR